MKLTKSCIPLFSLFLLAAIVAPLPLESQAIITTLAGTDWSFRGNGAAAVNAPLGRVTGAAVDLAGNIYATDADNCLVVKIGQSGALNGVLSVVAGNYICGFSGDGGPATGASLGTNLAGLALDGSGNIYVADSQNNRVRMISGGKITTVAGNGSAQFSGEGSIATNAGIGQPSAVAVDGSGNLYIAATNQIRKVTPAGIISTFAGTGSRGFLGDSGPAVSALLNGPKGLALDSGSNLYIADTGNCRVRKVSNGTIATVAGSSSCNFAGDGGLAVGAGVAPYGVAIDGSGNLLIADGSNGRVRKISGANITTVAGTGAVGFAGDGGPANSVSVAMNTPQAVATDRFGNVYLADTLNGRVRLIDTTGKINTIVGNGQYRFSGDGSNAFGASLSAPAGLLLDSAGNLIVADSLGERIRKITAASIVSTVAGTGSVGYTGDFFSAINATFYNPSGVATDGGGNLYVADALNNAIRKISPGGNITSVAGGQPGGYNGDGIQASGAYLQFPTSVLVDGSGNLFITDSGNSRIRKVTSGIISTVAGNGASTTSGDNGPALSAGINTPTGLAMDASRNLFFAETGGDRVRKINSSGTISTVAGNGVRAFGGDGGLASNASLNQPAGVAVDTAGNVYVADTGNHRVRKVSLVPPSYSVTPATLAVTASAPAGSAPLSAQSINLSSQQLGLFFSTAVSTTDGANWLTVTPISGTMPATLAVTLDPRNLSPGRTYQGTIVISAPASVTGATTVKVTFNVSSTTPAQLGVSPTALIFQAQTGNTPLPQLLLISDIGGGSLNWNATAQTTSGGNWLSFLNAATTAAGSATSFAPSSLTTGVAQNTLPAGSYGGTVAITSNGGNIAVPASLLLSPPGPSLLVSPTSLGFTGVVGGGAIPAQQFAVVNVGTLTMNWTAQIITPNCSWLSIDTSSGSSPSVNSSPVAPLVTVNATSLPAVGPPLQVGPNTCQIKIGAPGAVGTSTMLVTVTQDVRPAGTILPPVLQPAGFVFIVPVKSSSPTSKTLAIATASPLGIQPTITKSTIDGSPWLGADQQTFTVMPGTPSTFTVQPKLDLLPTTPGTYFGFIDVKARDLASQAFTSLSVPVVMVLTPASSGASAASLRPEDNSSCTRNALYMKSTAQASQFLVTTDLAVTVQATVKDNCNSDVTSAAVAATFTSGEPQLNLTQVNTGVYQQSWKPNANGTTTISLQASSGGLSTSDSLSVNVAPGGVSTVIKTGGITQAASYAKGGFAPGGIVSVFGSNMGPAQGVQSSFTSNGTLPTVLAGVMLNIGGIDAPLYYAGAGQINAQLPFELPLGPQQVFLKINGNIQTPVSDTELVTAVGASPGVFSVGSNGKGQGVVVHGTGPNQNAVADPTLPASAGEVLVIYATGLGAVDQTVRSGDKSPGVTAGSVAANAKNPVTVTIGGQNAPVDFAGLTPGFVGLYQINVHVPAGVSGSAVPVVVTQAGAVSNTVTIAVQ